MTIHHDGDGLVPYNKDKIANSFRLPKHSILRALASLMDFTSSESREFTDEILSRSIEDDMRADWEAVSRRPVAGARAI